MPTFKVQGQVYHLIGSLLPATEPKFLQIYFVSDYNEQANIRSTIFSSLRYNLVTELQVMLHQINPYIINFKAALDSVPQSQLESYKFVISADRRPTAEHSGRHNAPTANEVAVVLVDQECDKRDIVLRTRDDRLQRITETHRAYDALQYPLIHCRGEDGYNFGIYHVDPTTGEYNFTKKTSALQFYCFLLQIRSNQYVYLQRFRGLFNQYLVDMYAKIETERLIYIRTNQTKLRAENYIDLRDALHQDTGEENLGRLVILPSSFTGGPRYMHERTQDAFCYVRKYGRPDLFITFTTNPKWNEIKKELLIGQASHDRHDIIARVFHLKLKLLIDLLTKEKVFGTTLCYMFSVEWQKRGLPHAHILIWLQDKIRPNDVDNLISAELPDPAGDPVLHDIIKTHMIHGPCGPLNNNSPCMQDGHCTKKYPKNMNHETVTGTDGYPSYRRRSPHQGGFTTVLRLRGQQLEIDNRWVVPYSPVLSKTFLTHLNVEVCSSVQSIKYICKYINKGSDQATLALCNERDEVTRFQSGRYISSSEAVWRILSFPIHGRHPPVVHLDVHVEGGQRVYFQPDNVRQRLENPRKTTLLAFFCLCETDEFAKTLIYDEVPSFYTYDKQEGVFNRRKRGTPVEGVAGVFREHVIGRVYTVHPNIAECYYLRMLLHIVRGPNCFAALKTFDGEEYPTFQAACRARHLLDDDQHWDDALAEACVSDSPYRLRHLFALLLVFCGLSDASQLWQKYEDKLAEDILRNFQQFRNIDGNLDDIYKNRARSQCLVAVQEIVMSMGGNRLSEYGLSMPVLDGDRINRDYATEIAYDPAELSQTLESGIPSFTLEQRAVFVRVCSSVDNEQGEILFLDAPGGTGKTFLMKIILAHTRRQGKIALAVASSGIAATLLPGGKTAHTMFKIPINLDSTESPVCNLSRNSDRAKVIKDCSLIVWDECTMAHRKALEAVNRTLQDLRCNDQPMAGITTLFAGDFRQTLPVVTNGTRADEIRACIKSSNLWPFITPMYLSINMRVLRGGNLNASQFSKLLLQIGDGKYPEERGEIHLGQNLCNVVHSVESLISSVYNDLSQVTNRENAWICERAILTPRNDQSALINQIILDGIDSEKIVYSSINRVMDQQDATNYPIEFLNSLSAPGLPAHTINLKKGVPIMLLRNISPPKLCNGTRLKVTSLQPNLIEAEILTGCGAGDQVLIPRIPLIPHNFPFQFKRIQFPVSVCYAMTINKSQGQTLRVAGVDLGTSCCFSHGQLYVAFSRVGNAENLYVHVLGDTTSNIVYREAL